MDSQFNELIRILDSGNMIYQKYLELLSNQQDYLINNDIDGIKLTIEKINQIAQAAIGLENARLVVIENISESMNTSPENLTIGKLLEKFKGRKYLELESLKKKILDTYNQVLAQKARNEMLIDQSMRIIGCTVDLITGANEPANTYEDIIAQARIQPIVKSIMTRIY